MIARSPAPQPLLCSAPLVCPDELLALFRAGAFWAQDRTVEDLQTALDNSKPMVTARVGDRLMGFARATSDGVYRGTIWDVVVHPEVQGQGIGRRLVETLLSHPHLARVERVYLMTTYKEKFYERVGFQRNGSTTMVLHNHAVYNNTADVGAGEVTPAQANEQEQEVSVAIADH